MSHAPFDARRGETLRRVSKVLLERGGELGFGAAADDGFDEGAVLKDEQSGDAGDVVVLGGAGVFIDIELADEVAAFGFGGELVDDGGDRAAGAAPGGPGVDQDGLGAGAAEDL